MLAACLNLHSTPAGDINLQPVEAQIASGLQQFKFVAATLARASGHHLVGRHSGLFTKFRFWISQAAQLVPQFNRHWIYTSTRCTGLWFQQKHQYRKLRHRLHRIYWLCLHRKLTSSRFSPSMGFWQRDAGIGWTHALKCAHAYS